MTTGHTPYAICHKPSSPHDKLPIETRDPACYSVHMNGHIWLTIKNRGCSLARIILLALIMALLAAACAVTPAEPSPPPASPTVDINCTDTNPHPVGESIAETFDVPYEDVMTWFCGGETFDDILLALQTSQLADRPVEEILEMKNDVGWEQTWEALGLTQE